MYFSGPVGTVGIVVVPGLAVVVLAAATLLACFGSSPSAPSCDPPILVVPADAPINVDDISGCLVAHVVDADGRVVRIIEPAGGPVCVCP